jgi:hypothetical protein
MTAFLFQMSFQIRDESIIVQQRVIDIEQEDSPASVS